MFRAFFVYGYLIVASDDNVKSRITARKCLFLKTTSTLNALNSSSRHNCAGSSRSCQKGLAPGRYLRFPTTDDYLRRSLNNETSCTRIVVEPRIIRWPGRHELVSDIFTRTAVSEFIGSSGRPLGHGNKMTKWQDNGTPRAKQRELFFCHLERARTCARTRITTTLHHSRVKLLFSSKYFLQLNKFK